MSQRRLDPTKGQSVTAGTNAGGNSSIACARQALSPLRAAAAAFVEQREAALERMVIHRNGNAAMITITGDATFSYAVRTLHDGHHAVDISPQRPAPHISKQFGHETFSPRIINRTLGHPRGRAFGLLVTRDELPHERWVLAQSR